MFVRASWKQKSANTSALARSARRVIEKPKLIVEYLETAARNHRRHVTARKTKIRVSREGRILNQVRLVAVRVHGIRGEIMSKDRVVRRDGEGDDLIDTQQSTGKAAVHSPDHASRVGHVRPVGNGGLFNGAASFAAANNFKQIVEASPQLSFRPRAASRQERQRQYQRE